MRYESSQQSIITGSVMNKKKRTQYQKENRQHSVLHQPSVYSNTYVLVGQ